MSLLDNTIPILLCAQHMCACMNADELLYDIMTTVNVHSVCFRIKFTSINGAVPPAEELEAYVAQSRRIPENVGNIVFGGTCTVPVYEGNLTFRFWYESDPEDSQDLEDSEDSQDPQDSEDSQDSQDSEDSVNHLATELLGQSYSDGVWEAPPGDGSFVYPCLHSAHADAALEACEQCEDGILGFLSYEWVSVDGTRFS